MIQSSSSSRLVVITGVKHAENEQRHLDKGTSVIKRKRLASAKGNRLYMGTA